MPKAQRKQRRRSCAPADENYGDEIVCIVRVGLAIAKKIFPTNADVQSSDADALFLVYDSCGRMRLISDTHEIASRRALEEGWHVASVH